MPANMDDFLGEGLNDLADAPALTEEQKRRSAAIAAARAEAERVAGIPYGSPESPTAGHYQETYLPAGTIAGNPVGASGVTHRINPDGSKTVIADYSDAHPYDPQNPGYTVGTTAFPEDAQGGAHSLDSTLSDEGDSTGQIQDDAGVRSDEGATDRRNALQDVIDRMEAAGKLDTSQQDESRRVQQEAASQKRQLFAQANAFAPKAAAQAYSENALSASLAIARSAPGGASRESALMNALEAAPAAQAEGQRQANSEARSQQNVALQASSQLGQLASQTRQQDEGQAEAFTSIGLDVAKQIANFTGANLNLDQRDREFLGEVALQTAQLDLDVEKLGVEETLRRLELQLAKEGLDQEWKQFKASQKITGKDILGGIFGLGGSVVSGLFTGLAAKK